MPAIQSCDLPSGALLDTYRQRGAYVDCYVTDVARAVAHAEYVEAFYTTAVFKAERLILKWVVARPSTDQQAGQLAAGALDAFAAWNVEGRAPDQLLLSDFTGRTKSWLMVATVPGSSPPHTRLYFGSGVVPEVSSKSGQSRMGLTFRALLGFHKLYSRVLLHAATSRLARQDAGPG